MNSKEIRGFTFCGKVTIPFSYRAYDLFEHDRMAFEGGDRTTFFQTIIKSYMFDSMASIELRLIEKEEECRKKYRNKDNLEELVRNDVEEYKEFLYKNRDELLSGDRCLSPKYSLSQDLERYLKYDEKDKMMDKCVENKHYTSPSRYLHAVIEDFFQKPFIERERILKKDIIREIESYMDEDHRALLRLNYLDGTRYIKPYKIAQDRFSLYSYVAGIEYDSTKKEKYFPSSLRISRINAVEKYSIPLGELTIDEMDAIEDKLYTSGIQYLKGECVDVVVELTEAGVQRFNDIAYARPVPIETDKNVYHFYCSQLQARNYFVEFGEDVTIIEPKSLKDSLQRFFEEASSIYND